MILLQQPIPVFDRVRKLSRSSADSALYRSAERPRIAALTIRVLPHGRPRIAARQPSENRRGVSAEKGKFSVSRTVFHNQKFYNNDMEQKSDVYIRI